MCILLTLLHLGIKNIRLGPTLPAFLSPNVLNYLVENFHIAPVTTPEEEMCIRDSCSSSLPNHLSFDLSLKDVFLIAGDILNLALGSLSSAKLLEFK